MNGNRAARAMIRAGTIRFAERPAGPRPFGHAACIPASRLVVPRAHKPLRRSSNSHDRQMPAPAVELNVKFQPRPRLTPNQRPRPGTRRPAWPTLPRFEARLAGRPRCSTAREDEGEKTTSRTPSTNRSAHGSDRGLAVAVKNHHAEPRPRELLLPKVESRGGGFDSAPGRPSLLTPTGHPLDPA